MKYTKEFYKYLRGDFTNTNNSEFKIPRLSRSGIRFLRKDLEKKLKNENEKRKTRRYFVKVISIRGWVSMKRLINDYRNTNRDELFFHDYICKVIIPNSGKNSISEVIQDLNKRLFQFEQKVEVRIQEFQKKKSRPQNKKAKKCVNGRMAQNKIAIVNIKGEIENSSNNSTRCSIILLIPLEPHMYRK